jgi:hypothetical protein
MHRKRSIYQQALSPNRAIRVLLLFLHLLRVRKEHGYDAEQREAGTYVEDEVYARIAFRHAKGMFSFKKEHKIKENVAFWYPILHFIVYYV